MSNKQIKSKSRVKEHGEVYTNPREVNAMLDLVKNDSYNIDSTFLEPACGNGNFLIEILTRKLQTVKEMYKSRDLYEINSIKAIMSIYGVDILEDNIQECIDRLYSYWESEYKNKMKRSQNPKAKDVVKYVLSRNILCGNTLTMLNNNGTPLVFSEWKFITLTNIKRKDYTLSEMLKSQEILKSNKSLSYKAENTNKPIKTYPVCNYLEVINNV